MVFSFCSVPGFSLEHTRVANSEYCCILLADVLSQSVDCPAVEDFSGFNPESKVVQLTHYQQQGMSHYSSLSVVLGETDRTILCSGIISRSGGT